MENKRRILADWGLGGKQKHGHNHLSPSHNQPAPRRGTRPQPLPQYRHGRLTKLIF